MVGLFSSSFNSLWPSFLPLLPYLCCLSSIHLIHLIHPRTPPPPQGNWIPPSPAPACSLATRPCALVPARAPIPRSAAAERVCGVCLCVCVCVCVCVRAGVYCLYARACIFISRGESLAVSCERLRFSRCSTFSFDVWLKWVISSRQTGLCMRALCLPF